MGIDCDGGKTIFFMWESERKEFKTSPEVSNNFTDLYSLVLKRCLKWCISSFLSEAFLCYSVL